MSKRAPLSVFGLRLRSARERTGLSQERVGVLIGLDEGSSSARISRYEMGVHAAPFDIARNIARVLGIPTAYLYCEDDALAEILLGLSALSPEELSEARQMIDKIKDRRKPPPAA